MGQDSVWPHSPPHMQDVKSTSVHWPAATAQTRSGTSLRLCGVRNRKVSVIRNVTSPFLITTSLRALDNCLSLHVSEVFCWLVCFICVCYCFSSCFNHSGDDIQDKDKPA